VVAASACPSLLSRNTDLLPLRDRAALASIFRAPSRTGGDTVT
jgi:hypothetical protein